MRSSAFLIILIMFSSGLTAQDDPIRTVVLINGVPFLADVSTEGDILHRYQQVDNYFTTKESHRSIVSRLSDSPEISGDPIAVFPKQEEPIPSFTEENKAPILSGEAQYIGFSPDKAILTKSAVDQIRKIADQYQAGQIGDILIISYHLDNYRARSLARNRARGIKELLSAFGTPREKVDFEIRDVSIGTKIDFVQVQFL